MNHKIIFKFWLFIDDFKSNKYHSSLTCGANKLDVGDSINNLLLMHISTLKLTLLLQYKSLNITSGVWIRKMDCSFDLCKHISKVKENGEPYNQ